MNKRLAFDNRLCYERDVARQHAIHHQKLATIVPTSHSPSRVYLDSSTPVAQPHLATNAKRLQLERERQMIIYQQNQRLADRMEHIMHRQENVILAASATLVPTPPPTSHRAKPSTSEAQSAAVTTDDAPLLTSPRLNHARSPRKQPLHSPAYVHIPGVRLDAHQTPLVDCHLSPEFAMGRGNACKKQSLVNKTVQRRQQEKIEEENRRLKQRLAQLKPYYNTRKWDGEWQEHAKRFSHLRQDGTVGYLLPSPKTARAGDSRSPSRRAIQRPNSRAGNDQLPSINSPRNSPRSDKNLSERNRRGPHRKLRCDSFEEDEEMQLVELPTYTLLEATTKKGVEISVGELQIELVGLREGSKATIGDRGLVVFGTWNDGCSTFEGQFLVDYSVLEYVAQEIDDLETMIKLETVTHVPDIGNFPRLSSLLTEEELQQLLTGIIHRLRFQLLTDTKELRISCRIAASTSPLPTSPRSSRPRSESEPIACTQPSRPRTCPSTFPNETVLPDDRDCSSAESIEVKSRYDYAATIETIQTAVNGCRGISKRRMGMRVNDQFVVLTCYFEPETITLDIEELVVGTSRFRRASLSLSFNQAAAIAQDLSNGIGLQMVLVNLLADLDFNNL